MVQQVVAKRKTILKQSAGLESPDLDRFLELEDEWVNGEIVRELIQDKCVSAVGISCGIAFCCMQCENVCCCSNEE